MVDTQFEALADPHRRRLLVALLDHNPQHEVPIPEGMDEGDEELETLQWEMFHMHLPKLEAAGFIEWDQENHEVVKGPEFEEIRPLLTLITEHADELPVNWP